MTDGVDEVRLAPPRVRWRSRLAAWTAAVLLAGCALNPVTGRPEPVLTTLAGEVELGREQTDKLRREIGFVEDGATAAYVREVGLRVAAHAPRRDLAYEFHIVEMEEPNAFALPGGFVFVSRGLLVLLNGEDELANVLGHEIGHVAARHAVQRASLHAPFAILTGVGQLATGIVSSRLSDLVGDVGGVAGGLVLSPYGRKQEREADVLGQRMAAAAGWDPAALPRFLTTLEREELVHTGRVRETAFLDSHPSTPERERATRVQAETITVEPAPPIAAGRAAFLGRLDGLRVGPNPGEGVFVGGRFLHPLMDFAIDLPPSWQALNGSTFVAGRPRDGSALVLLQIAGKGEDPELAAAAFERESGVRLEDGIETTRIGTLLAARGIARSRDLTFELTWIAHSGLVHQILAAAPSEHFATIHPALARVAESFRPLTDADRGKINDYRLRMVEARRGETLDDLLARTATVWKADMALLANGIESAADVRAGDLLKLPIPERYVAPAPPSPS